MNQNKAQNRVNFITLGRISEQEKIEIIQRGFQLQAEGKISLKKYYESTGRVISDCERSEQIQIAYFNLKDIKSNMKP